MKPISFGKVAVIVLLTQCLFAAAIFANPLYKVTNVSPSPTLTNEFYLTATNITTSIGGTNVRVMVYMDDPPGGGGAPRQIPGPLIELTVGQTVICHFKNNLTNNIEGATVHWHGIELDNDSDGTAVTQDTIFPGQTYTYRFTVPRPGVYWYHSHMLPGSTTFGGMYGPLIVKNPEESALIAANILPSTNYTFPLVLSDISFTNGEVGKVVDGVNYSINTLIHFCENQIFGVPGSPPANACGEAGNPGSVFLCNGSPPVRSGTLCSPTTNSAPVFYIGKNQRIRLQIMNASISRNTYLTLRYPCSNPSGNTNLYQIGGQGGLLDSAVLNGGVQSGYDFKYGRGTVSLGSGMRTDVMFYSSGNNGDVIQLVGNGLPSDIWRLSSGSKVGTNYPVAFFVITNGGSTNLPLAAGSPILTAVGGVTEDLSLLSTNTLAAPPSFSQGTQSGLINFSNSIPTNGDSTGPTIGGYAATPLDGNSGYGSWDNVPHPPTALWARSGTVLQLAIANNTDAAHPYHLHGFSMQPVAIYTANLQSNLFNFPYNEFVDTIDIMPGQALVFRVKLEDRPVIADSATGGPVTTAVTAATGGGLGRWLMHCHIFLHGAVGMISELVVIPNTSHHLVGHAAGLDSTMVLGSSGTSWTASTNAPWLHLLPGYTSGTGITNVIYSYDANPGPTRVGELHVAGKTVEVTQAGTNYVRAPQPLTALVTNGINAPYGITTDDAGNVYFADSANGAIKRWNKSNNTVTTLTSGWSTPYGVAIDRLGNIYFSQNGDPTIKKRFATFPNFVVTLFTNNTSGVPGIAVDASGNVYITVPSQNAVKKWTASTGTLTTLITSGLSDPYGVAVDAAGRVYVADIGNDSVKRLDNILGGQFWNTLVNSNFLNNPYGVAVDDGGNVYIADGNNDAIKRWNATNGSVTTIVSSGIDLPTGVAVDGTGNLFFSDWNNDAIRELPYAYIDPAAKSEPAEVTTDTLPVVLPPTQNLLPPFAPSDNQIWIGSLSNTNGIVKFTVGANPGAPRSGQITLLGTNITINQAGAWFALGTTNLLIGPAAGSSTITAAVIPAINSWSGLSLAQWLQLPATSGTGTTNILFTYDANTGATRTGSLIINGQVVTITQAGSTYVQAPGPLTTLVSASNGLSQPWGVAAGSSGNVIFSDINNTAVKMWTPGINSVSSIITNGLSDPRSTAVDGAGNVYVADFFFRTIKKRRASDGVVVTVADDWPNNISGVALDSATNVYWSGPSTDSVKKWTATSGSISTLVATNLNGAYGIAVDVAGRVFIADTLNHAIKQWNPVTSSLTTVGTNGINMPWNIAVDGSGNLYVANGGTNNNVVKWTAANGTFATLVASGLNTPTGISVDEDQNVYIADFGNNAIKELPRVFVDASAKSEPATAGTNSLSVILPSDQSLQPPYAPTDNASWLNIISATNGVVTYGYEANTNNFVRAASITLFGRNILVQQAGIVPPPSFTDITMLSNGVFQLSFTNGLRGENYSVLFSTNLLTPITNWIVIGTAETDDLTTWKFTDESASNSTRFYRIRTP